MDETLARECRAQMRALTDGLVALERDEDADVDDLFRTAHSLKGNLGMAGRDDAAALAHAVEDVLSAVRAGRLDATADPAVVDVSLSAVDAVATALDDGDAAVDAAAVETRVRDVLADRATAPDDGGDTTDDGAEPVAETADSGVAPGDPDLTVEEALDRAAEFDDLERLVAEMDDDASEFDGLEGGGTFAELTGEDTDEGGTTGEPTAAESPAEETTNTGTETFAEIREEVDGEGDVERLDRELAEVEFGEFDDDDDLSIQELVELDAADPVLAADEAAGATASDDDPADEDADPPELDLPGPEADAADDEATAADDDATAADDDATADPEPVEDATADPESVEDATADPTPAFDFTDPADLADPGEAATGPDDGQAAEAPALDVSVEDAVADDETPTDADEGVAEDVAVDLADAADAGTAEDDATTAASAAGVDAEAADAGDEGRPTSEEVAPTAEPDADPAEAPPTDDAASPEGSPTDTTEAAGSAASEPGTAGDSADPVEAAAPETDDDPAEPADPEVALPDVDLDLDESGTDVEDVQPAAAAAADADLPETEPDLDVEFPDLDTSVEAADADVEGDLPEFARDRDVEAFESRFGGLFDGEDEEESGPSVLPATTIDESTLDADAFRPAGDPPETRPVATTDAIQSITVDVENADALLNLVEELSVARLTLDRAVGEDPDDEVEAGLSALGRVTGEFRRTVMDLRLMPFERALEGLPRVVRDVAREADKEVDFETAGTDVRLDRSIIDRLGEPLVHAVRNAVDHGIEAPEEREAAGKPREGTVRVTAERERDRVVVEVSDDGRGLDRDEILDAAVEAEVVDAETAQSLPRGAVFDLLFEPGFTTTHEVTAVSGRGVGMDVIDRVVSDLGGDVAVESTPGEGTTLRLTLPVTVAVDELLFVAVGDERFGIPVDAVQQVTERAEETTVNGETRVRRPAPAGGGVDPGGTATGPGAGVDAGAGGGGVGEDGGDDPETDSPTGEGETVPLVHLGDVLAVPGAVAADGPLVWVTHEGETYALRCDRVIGTEESVVKPYEGILGGIEGVSGATMLGDGNLVNVIDVVSL